MDRNGWAWLEEAWQGKEFTMTREAARAIENKLAFECKKDGLQQRQDGSWILRLTVHPNDMKMRLAQAAMGTRYQCVLVEINDDETPVDHVAIARSQWRDLGPTKQAGIRCSDPVFWAFLSEEKRISPDVNDHEAAAQIVRTLCRVTSRSQLDKPGFQASRVLWYGLDQEFQAWKALQSRG
jgi:hypothetical protein